MQNLFHTPCVSRGLSFNHFLAVSDLLEKRYALDSMAHHPRISSRLALDSREMAQRNRQICNPFPSSSYNWMTLIAVIMVDCITNHCAGTSPVHTFNSSYNLSHNPFSGKIAILFGNSCVMPTSTSNHPGSWIFLPLESYSRILEVWGSSV